MVVVIVIVVIVIVTAAVRYLTSITHLTSESLPPDLSPKTHLLSPTREKTFTK